VFVFVAAMASTSRSVFAQSSGFYAGGAVRKSAVKDGCNSLPAGVSCDDKDTGYKVFGDHQVNGNFGVELGYVELGKLVISIPGLSANIKSDGFEFLGLGTLPLADKFSAYDKLGFSLGMPRPQSWG
jgi:OOP family OmpA-OmpF porin